jgi:two-component system LytT family sensor kinase
MATDGLRTSRVVALALLVGTLFTAQAILIDVAAGRTVKLGQRIWIALLFWVVWALLTPVVLAALRRWPRSLAVHLGIAPLLSALQTTITLVAHAVSAHEAYLQGVSPAALVWGVFTGVFYYGLVAVLYTALRFRTELGRAKLDVLRSQLRPHFLFNTLNAISGLVAEDSEAHRMLLRLSTLLRRSLDEQSHEVTLQQELAFLNDYLDIQRVRFGDRLTVQLTIDPTVLNARVPVFLLQPLLENAIEHGGSDDGCTTIDLTVTRNGGTLDLVLEDHGPGISATREGIGLSNTRERLLHLYGPHASVTLGSTERGARVELHLPFDENPRR